MRWLKLIRELQAAGVTVLYEIDDYVQAARKNKSHELSDAFDAERVRDMEMVDARRRRHHLLDRLPRPPLPLVQRAHLGLSATASTSTRYALAEAAARRA